VIAQVFIWGLVWRGSYFWVQRVLFLTKVEEMSGDEGPYVVVQDGGKLMKEEKGLQRSKRSSACVQHATSSSDEDVVNSKHKPLSSEAGLQNTKQPSAGTGEATQDVVKLDIPIDSSRKPVALKQVNFSRSRFSTIFEKNSNRVVLHPKSYPVEIHFNTRNHRKGRFPKLVFLKEIGEDELQNLKSTRWASWEPQNISWWVGVTFTIGSICWIFNGCFAMWPLEDTKTNLLLTQYWALAGASWFEIGAYCAVLEAINPNNCLEFGFEVMHILHNKKTVIKFQNAPVEHNLSLRRKNPGWRWWAFEMDDAGKKAAMVQMVGATLFLISCILGVPNMSATDLLIPSKYFVLQDLLLWSTQIVGSTCFIYAAIVLMMETQKKWYLPNFRALGWNLNFFNLIGGVGFFICAVFALLGNVNGRVVCCQYWGNLFSTFWGSIAFLIGSYLLVLEVANKNPVHFVNRVPSRLPLEDKMAKNDPQEEN